jgi:hypothetical protein
MQPQSIVCTGLPRHLSATMADALLKICNYKSLDAGAKDRVEVHLPPWKSPGSMQGIQRVLAQDAPQLGAT